MNRLGNGTIEVKKKDLHLCTYVPSKTKLKKKKKKRALSNFSLT